MLRQKILTKLDHGEELDEDETGSALAFLEVCATESKAVPSMCSETRALVWNVWGMSKNRHARCREQ